VKPEEDHATRVMAIATRHAIDKLRRRAVLERKQARIGRD